MLQLNVAQAAFQQFTVDDEDDQPAGILRRLTGWHFHWHISRGSNHG
jgi:hypothetical protein